MNLIELKKLIKKTGAHARKTFSQNFLHNEYTLSKIAEAIPENSGFYVEIGGGLGSLTEFAVKRELFPLTVIDIDDRMLEVLTDRFPDVEVLKADGAKLDVSDRKGKKGVVFGNLPYQVSSPVVMNTCYQSSNLEGAVFLLQKEVAEKFCALPGSRDFGPVAALIRKVGTAEYLFTVEPEDFYPAPKVHSAVVSIKFNDHKYEKGELKKFADIMRILFSNRRKTLNNVFKINGLDPEILENFNYAKIRSEELDWETIQQIAEHIGRS
jgi:16S rRNA (adenine1518-N6/adenine1519-N6)-dimethyltransferase